MPISPPGTPGSDADPCPICQESIATCDQKITECGHAFHAECLGTWCETAVTCPVCRTVISSVPSSPIELAAPQIDFVTERNIVSLFSGVGFVWYTLTVLGGSSTWFEILSIIYNLCGMVGAMRHNLCLLYIYSASWPFQAAILILAVQYEAGALEGPRDDAKSDDPHDSMVFTALYLCACGFVGTVGFIATCRMVSKLRKYEIALHMSSRQLESPTGFYNSIV
jgi:hypothetical protein